MVFYDLLLFKKPYIKTFINGGLAYLPVRIQWFIAKKIRLAIQRIIYAMVNLVNPHCIELLVIKKKL